MFHFLFQNHSYRDWSVLDIQICRCRSHVLENEDERLFLHLNGMSFEFIRKSVSWSEWITAFNKFTRQCYISNANIALKPILTFCMDRTLLVKLDFSLDVFSLRCLDLSEFVKENHCPLLPLIEYHIAVHIIIAINCHHVGIAIASFFEADICFHHRGRVDMERGGSERGCIPGVNLVIIITRTYPIWPWILFHLISNIGANNTETIYVKYGLL